MVVSLVITIILNFLWIIRNLFKYLFLYIKLDLKQFNHLAYDYIQAHKNTIELKRVNIYLRLVYNDLQSGEHYV